MKIGYARVSTLDQNPQLQLDALHAAGCDRIFTDEGVSGSKAHRPQLDAALDHLREGDTLVVWRLDRLGRNTRNLLDLVDRIHSKGAELKSLHEQIDTSSANGKLVFTLMAALAEFERSLVIERTKAGLAAAHASGKGGRKPKLTAQQREDVRLLRSRGRTLQSLADSYHVGISTIRRALEDDDCPPSTRSGIVAADGER
ncbi:recombinase family protein [Bifidobacterium aerophilum]|uniref:Resolvase/invertase-type recombinase catalytic domain-containing protein n=1 Tax=Bifidobacterium aerophilum TaxID=1798155 RepID=A0A6N9Z3X3_9BIFI|nr:recombinase family protein [Bifidobacterium aerophilum]NEG89120.1 hypothetical protein [Bifidobacterium aerophilum]